MSDETKTFSLAGKALKLSTADDLSAHTSTLTTSPSAIEHVNFTGNTLGIEASATLASTLKQCTNLLTANFSDIFTGRLLSEIPTALSNLLTALLECPKLHTIDLSDNAFGLNTVEPLRPFLSQHTPLQHLILNNNGLGPSAGTLVAEALVQLADKKRQARADGREVVDLETVVCGRNRLETGSMAAWVKAYAANDKVQTVKMVQNGIRQEGIAVLLSQGLSCCKGLRVLDLQDNTFTALAAKTLAEVLGKWGQLRELGVGDCLLGGRGGVNVAAALAKGGNKDLEVLRLQYNEIDGRGLKALAEAVENVEGALPTLRRVELNGNKFNEEDPNIEKLQLALAKRKENPEDKYPGVDEDDEDAWGLDELDELEDEDSEDEDEQAEDEGDAEEEKIVKDADEAANEEVAQEKDKNVDDLADALGKTEIK